MTLSGRASGIALTPKELCWPVEVTRGAGRKCTVHGLVASRRVDLELSLSNKRNGRSQIRTGQRPMFTIVTTRILVTQLGEGLDRFASAGRTDL